MFPKGTQDPEYPDDATQSGVRNDGRNLVQEWQDKHQVMGAPGCWGLVEGQGQGFWSQDCGLKLVLSLPEWPVCVEPNSAHSGIPGPLCNAPHG